MHISTCEKIQSHIHTTLIFNDEGMMENKMLTLQKRLNTAIPCSAHFCVYKHLSSLNRLAGRGLKCWT